MGSGSRSSFTSSSCIGQVSQLTNSKCHSPSFTLVAAAFGVGSKLYQAVIEDCENRLSGNPGRINDRSSSCSPWFTASSLLCTSPSSSVSTAAIRSSTSFEDLKTDSLPKVTGKRHQTTQVGPKELILKCEISHFQGSELKMWKLDVQIQLFSLKTLAFCENTKETYAYAMHVFICLYSYIFNLRITQLIFLVFLLIFLICLTTSKDI